MLPYFKTLTHLPNLPNDLVEHAWWTLQNRLNDIEPNRGNPPWLGRVLKRDGKTFESSHTERFDLGADFHQWIRKHIVSQWTECSISRTKSDISPFHGPHTDISRAFVLMYPLTTGGEQCRTVWYRERGKSFYRPGRKMHTVNDYDNLIVKDTKQLPLQTWTIMTTDYLHGVENMTEDRISIQIGLMDHYGLLD